MRGGRYGKYGEFKRNERLKASKEAKRISCQKKIRSGSRLQKFEHDKFFSENKESTTNGHIKCKCGAEMEFYGVDGTGGSKYGCLKCYDKRIIR